jgi:hypothetical protein
MAARLVGLATLLTARVARAQRPKILALHGGDETVAQFQSSSGMAALMSSLSSQYDFVFPQATRRMWMPDGSYPTDSINILNTAVSTQGPFVGILGYSQGGAMAIAYLGIAPVGTFQFIVTYCAGAPDQPALEAAVDSQRPFGGIPSLFFLGGNDPVMSRQDTMAATIFFTAPTIITSSSAGHHLPLSTDSTFNTILNFFTTYLPAPSAPPSPPLPPFTTPPPLAPPSPSPPLLPTTGAGAGGNDDSGGLGVGLVIGGVILSVALLYACCKRKPDPYEPTTVLANTAVNVDGLTTSAGAPPPPAFAAAAAAPGHGMV